MVGIIEGNWGFPIRLTCKEDGVAADISAFTTRQFLFRAPDGVVTTKTAVFHTDGTDGVLTYTVENGLFDAPGGWEVQVFLSKVDSAIASNVLTFQVGRALA